MKHKSEDAMNKVSDVNFLLMGSIDTQWCMKRNKEIRKISPMFSYNAKL